MLKTPWRFMFGSRKNRFPVLTRNMANIFLSVQQQLSSWSRLFRTVILFRLTLKRNRSPWLNADVCKESRRDKCKITNQRRHRRIRDREPSRIPVSRVLRKLKKRTFIYRTNHPPFPLNCYLYPYKHRTHSPKLRLPIVLGRHFVRVA